MHDFGNYGRAIDSLHLLRTGNGLKIVFFIILISIPMKIAGLSGLLSKTETHGDG